MDSVLITNVIIAIVIYEIFTRVIYLIFNLLTKFYSKLIFKRKLKKQLEEIKGAEVSD